MTLVMDTFPQLLGFGIDERTTLFVQGHVAEVIGPNKVAVYDRKKPLRGELDYEVMAPGDRYDMRERRILDEQ